MKQIACLFPGIGYTCDKPLLYYSWKLLSKQGWEIVPVQYSGFPSGVKGNPEKMQKAAKMALEQAEEILRDIHWNKYDQILFVAKSVGTVVSCAYAQRHQISCRSILFTPVEETFLFPAGDSDCVPRNGRSMGQNRGNPAGLHSTGAAAVSHRKGEPLSGNR